MPPSFSPPLHCVETIMTAEADFELKPTYRRRATPQQEQVWLLETMLNAPDSFVGGRAIRIDGPLDVDRLNNALTEIIKETPLLESRCLFENSELTFVTCSGGTAQRLSAETVQPGEDPWQEALSKPFDLFVGPAWRVRLFQEAPETYVLVIGVHAILSDRTLGADWILERLFSRYDARTVAISSDPSEDVPGTTQHWNTNDDDDVFWARELEHTDTVASLPSFAEIGQIPGCFLKQSIPLSSEAHDALSTLSNRPGVSPSHVIAATLIATLARYNRGSGVTIGMGSSALAGQAAKPALGAQETLVPLYSPQPAMKSMNALIEEIGVSCQRIGAHSKVSLGAIQRAAGLEVDGRGGGLFDVVFDIGAGSAAPVPPAGLNFTALPSPPRPILQALHVSFDDCAPTPTLHWVFQDSRFTPDIVTRFARHMDRILALGCAAQDKPVFELEMLDDRNIAEIRGLWNTRTVPLPHRSMVEAIQAQCHRTPDAVAIEHADHSLTYSALDLQSSTLARHLVGRGAKPGDHIGLLSERSCNMIVAILAIIKAGGVIVPLDIDYPHDRLAFMAKDATLRFAVTALDSDLEDALVTSLNGAIIISVTDAQIPQSEHALPALGPDAPIYMIYTSGSTGTPKGALLSHGALVNLTLWHRETWIANPGLRTLLFAPISFDVAFHEILVGLATGATLIQIDDALRSNAMELLVFCTRARIQKWYMPFVTLQQVAQAASVSCYPETLKEVIVGGEPLLATEDIKHFVRQTGCRIRNHYGSTESIDSATHTLEQPTKDWRKLTPIGPANVHNMNIFLLDDHGQPVPRGAVGEIFTAGACLALGYHGRPDLTASTFVPNPFAVQGDRLYKTGDLGRYLPDGSIECLGRKDHQAKVRGYRIEPAEVELCLAHHPQVVECAVAVRQLPGGSKALIGYVVSSSDVDPLEHSHVLRQWLSERLPNHMVPMDILMLDALPMTPSGKVAKRMLPNPDEGPKQNLARSSGHCALVVDIWSQVLGRSNIDLDRTFFEQGGDSLLLVQLHVALCERLRRKLPFATVFHHATPRRLAQFLEDPLPVSKTKNTLDPSSEGSDIAVIGMACRVPGASDLAAFWRLLKAGRSAIRTLNDNDLTPEALRVAHKPNFVRTAALLGDIDKFDARFFGYSAAEAKLIDPQQRMFLECAWTAFEDAGIDPIALDKSAGVFAGGALSTYLINNVLPARNSRSIFSSHRYFDSASELLFEQGNAGDHLATRVSYKLNLDGPSVNVQSTCSTSLVAVHMACQAIRSGDCELALAGGVAVITPEATGYLWQDGMMLSPDGQCRAFDADANGTVFGNGMGAVILKSRRQAEADGDRIYCVIKGSAINNDGGAKQTYSAPNGVAQTAVIRAAQQQAQIHPDQVSYVEAHGTGTSLGDPIEIAALAEAFGPGEPGACAIGSVKTAIGHLDEAAGIVGLIKTALSLKYATIPPSLNFNSPNPRLDLDSTPFRVVTAAEPWVKRPNAPRRAGVSAFGMGGTNCHVILEEAVEATRAHQPQTSMVVPLSANSLECLNALQERYLELLKGPESALPRLEDLTTTAAIGRKHFEHRAAYVARTTNDLRDAIIADRRRADPKSNGPLAFLYTGQGAQYAKMGHELFHSQPVFRAAMEECDALAQPVLERSLCDLIYHEPDAAALDRTALAQPGLFAIGIALHKLWGAWGVVPDLSVGHSLGEYVAACSLDVFSLEDGLRIVAARGRLMQALPQTGGMAQVMASEHAVRDMLQRIAPDVSVAAINQPDATVISGPLRRVSQVIEAVQSDGIDAVRLNVSHAFHSEMMRPILADFREVVASARLSEPMGTLVSTLTGDVVAGERLTDPDYWTEHVIAPVRFSDALTACHHAGVRSYVEIGPKPTLISFGRNILHATKPLLIPSIVPKEPGRMHNGLAQLYVTGRSINWDAYVAPLGGQRISLPTYPFARDTHWIEGPVKHAAVSACKLPVYLARSKQVASDGVNGPDPSDWWITGDVALSNALTEVLTTTGHRMLPDAKNAIVLLDGTAAPGINPADQALHVSQTALRHMQTILREGTSSSIWLVGLYDNHRSKFAVGSLAALACTATAEHPELRVRSIVLDRSDPKSDAKRLLAGIGQSERAGLDTLSVQDSALFTSAWSPLAESQGTDHDLTVDPDGTYLITGGTSGIGLRLAQTIAQKGPGRLVLLSRSGRPAEADQPVWAALHAIGTKIDILRCNASDQDALRTAIAPICDARLKGVFHCAGVLDDGVLLNQTAKRMADVIGPKITGGWILHEMTQDLKLDYFVMFSSTAAFLGTPGQVTYATANGLLDALAHMRRSLGLPALSINWGPWSSAGMSARLCLEARKRMEAQSGPSIAPEVALQALAAMCAHPIAQAAAADLDWQSMLVDDRLLTAPTETAGPTTTLMPEAETLEAQLEQLVLDFLDDPDLTCLDAQVGFEALGIDSVGALDLRRRINETFGTSLPVTALFDSPCFADLTKAVLANLQSTAVRAPMQTRALDLSEPDRETSVAIVGMALRFPGAPDQNTFWRMLAQGQDAVGPIPKDRWHAGTDNGDTGGIYIHAGAFIDDIDRFDAAHFKISPREAQSMDPRQRLLLETAWHAIENAGINPKDLRGSDTGVWIGCDEFLNDYHYLSSTHSIQDHYPITGGTLSFAAGRLSYVLGVHGPSQVVATACSSSLVALHAASQSIKAGECDMALVGGARLIIGTEETTHLCALQALSPDGRTKAFSNRADGFGRGEGCCVLLLQSAARAKADGTQILGFVRGSATNHDGPSAGLTVPSASAQQTVIKRALVAAGLSPCDVDYVEAHGTGTDLGDPIELNALDAVFGHGRDRPLYIGSVKANIGHLEEAAGLAGVAKVLLSFRHKAIPPQAQCDALTERIDWTQTPLKVPTAKETWPCSQPIAGVSAFGLSGTNAHVVLQAPTDDVVGRVARPLTQFDRQSFWPVPRSEEGIGRPKEETKMTTGPTPALLAPPSDESRQDILTYLTHSLAELLSMASADLSEDMRLDDLGADSISFMRLSRIIRDRYSINIAFQTLVEDIDTLGAMADFVAMRTHEDAPALLCNMPEHVPAAPPPKSLVRHSDAAETPTSYRKVLAAEELSQTQIDFLTDFVTEYSARTQASKAVAQKDRGYLANCRMPPFQPQTKEISYPIICRSSEGARFRDIDGNIYIDISMGYGVHFYGHQPKEIIDALTEQIGKGIHVGAQSDLAGEVAHMLSELSGKPKVAFCNSGTEAVMAALRFARAATGRSKFVMFEGSYHGWSDATLALPAGRTGSIAMARGIGDGSMEDVIVLDYGTDESLSLINEIASDLAAILVEPVQSRRPDLQPEQFLHQLRDIATASGAVLVFDEVITGFRLAQGGAQESFGIEADLVTYGKILGGGLPIGAVAGRKEIMDTVDGGDWSYGDNSAPLVPTTFFGGTFNKNPLAMASAHAVLRKIRADGGVAQENVASLVSWLKEEFNLFCGQECFPLEIVSFSSLFRFIGQGEYSLQRFTLAMDLFFQMMAHRGIYILETRVCFLSTAHSRADVEEILQTAIDCLHDLRRVGFFPQGTALPAPINLSDTLAADATLDESFTFDGTPVPPEHYENVLLTGATGFLGAYLLRDLLRESDAKIHCLIRAGDQEAARDRLSETCIHYSLNFSKQDWDRIVCHTGDLEAYQLGLSEKDWEQLGESIDAIYHCGAYVHSLKPYSKLRAANVGATYQLLHLSARARAKTFHHISSDAVFDSWGHQRHAVLYEDEPLAYHDSIFGGGYAESKWVADKLIEAARARGLAANIYRPGTLVGPAGSQVSRSDDFFAAYVAGCVQLGCLPETDATLDLAQVDAVSAQIVGLSVEQTKAQTYHLTNPAPAPFAELQKTLVQAGHCTKLVPYTEWEAALSKLDFEDGNPLFPLLPVFLETMAPCFRKSRMDTRNANTFSGQVQSDTRQVLQDYVEELTDTGYLPRP